MVEKMPSSQLGLVHVYTGNGKGKTTAALGLAMRALEHGFSVHMIQFLKGGTYTGELLAPQRYERFSISQFGKGSEEEPHFEDFEPDSHDRKRALAALQAAQKIMADGTDMLILDEINVALQLGHLKLDEASLLIKEKPKHTELVLTGRNAPEDIQELADYVTEMRAHKHPYHKGILGRKGVDY